MPELIFSLICITVVSGIIALIVFYHINLRRKDKINIKLTRNHKAVIFLLISFLIIYFHPTKEIMRCVGERSCVVEKTYLDSFTVKKKFKPASDSKLYCNICAYSFSKKAGLKYGLYLRYDGFAPFNFYIANSSYQNHKVQKNELNHICNVYQDKYDNYIKNFEKSTYNIKSMANADKLAPNVLVIIFLAYILLVFKKRKKEDWDNYKP